MSTSLLKKSLRLFEGEHNSSKVESSSNKKKKLNRLSGGSSNTKAKQATLKDKKVKSAIEAFVKKNPKQDKTLENLAVLDKLSLKNSVSQASAEKIISYQLKKQRKVYDQNQEKKVETSVFTDADFDKFEQEYFVKAK